MPETITSLIEKLEGGRDVQSRVQAAQQMRDDAERIKRLRYALNRIAQMSENAVYRIGIPGRTPDLGNIQQGFFDIKKEADEALCAAVLRAQSEARV